METNFIKATGNATEVTQIREVCRTKARFHPGLPAVFGFNQRQVVSECRAKVLFLNLGNRDITGQVNIPVVTFGSDFIQRDFEPRSRTICCV